MIVHHSLQLGFSEPHTSLHEVTTAVHWLQETTEINYYVHVYVGMWACVSVHLRVCGETKMACFCESLRGEGEVLRIVGRGERVGGCTVCVCTRVWFTILSIIIVIAS